MRTTVSLDEDLLREVRKRAAAERRTLSALVEEALREQMARRSRPPGEPYFAVTDGQGGIQPGVDVSDNARLRDLMEG